MQRLAPRALAAAASVRLSGNAGTCARSLSAAASSIPAQLETKRPDYLLKFTNASAMREAWHYSSYFLAAGVPAAFILGGPVATVVDLVLGVAIPFHAHVGMRSVIVDYVQDIPTQSALLAALAGVTVLTAVGITKLNLTDEGLTSATKSLWVKQQDPERMVLSAQDRVPIRVRRGLA